MRCALVPLLLALALIPALGTSASADTGCGGVGKPPCTILRPVAAPERDRSSVGWGQECIVIVGGLGSPTDTSDYDFFGTVLGDLRTNIDYRPVRFGVDAGDYDTTGAISRSGSALREVIRRISADCDAIHLLAHSMGGVVVDRALSKLEPMAHGISTYVAMASPHNGATMARLLRAVVEHDPLTAAAVSTVANALDAPDPSWDAVHDLVTARAPLRIPRVEHVRLRMLTDEIVFARDNQDRRVDVREYPPASGAEILGHGGIVHNERVQSVVRETIRSGRVPPPRPATW